VIVRALIAALAVVAGLPVAVAGDADVWLERMDQALASLSYRGVVVRGRGDNAEALKVYRVVEDGVVRERLVLQEGSGMEIIRHGDDVQCVLPDKRAVLVEKGSERYALFSPLPRDSGDLSAYRLELGDRGRVAGRETVIVDIQPNDRLRFARRLWLDADLALPLRVQSLAADGTIVDEIKFADVSFGDVIDESELVSRYAVDGFRRFPAADRSAEGVPSAWHSGNLPDGFIETSNRIERIRDKPEPMAHIIYSDGLSRVSVFVEKATGASTTTRSRMGKSSSYSTHVGEHRVTAVGAVPPETVERIALSMRR